MGVDISVILPCRNEESSLGKCIKQIKSVFEKQKIKGEIIVSDSSTDNSPKIAKSQKVKLVKHDEKGYGIAILKGIEKAKGSLIVIGDADGTYDFNELPLLLEKINQGYDLVLGNRLKGKIHKKAMPWLHRYIGNPFLSSILNLFFKTKVHDSHSGFRIIKKKALKKLDLKTTGMEFASEMIIKAAKNKLKITETPISYYPRKGKSKLKSFNDGWRHLRFMLMFSPTYLFFIPGIILFVIGFFLLTILLFGTIVVQGRNLGTYFLFLGSLLSVLGYQIINLGLYSRIYAIHTGFEKYDNIIDIIADKVSFERGIYIALIILLISILIFLKDISLSRMLFALTLVIIAVQTLFSVFFISIMLVEKK